MSAAKVARQKSTVVTLAVTSSPRTASRTGSERMERASCSVHVAPDQSPRGLQSRRRHPQQQCRIVFWPHAPHRDRAPSSPRGSVSHPFRARGFVERGSSERPERRPGRSRCSAGDAEQAERRFLRLLATKLKLTTAHSIILTLIIRFTSMTFPPAFSMFNVADLTASSKEVASLSKSTNIVSSMTAIKASSHPAS